MFVFFFYDFDIAPEYNDFVFYVKAILKYFHIRYRLLQFKDLFVCM